MSEIKPALTAEEWEELGNVNMVSFPNGTVLSPEKYKDQRYPRHAEAALALYDQPFGFTREDLEYVRFMASLPKLGGPDAKGNSLADRIEALLPPPDTGFTVTKPAEHISGSSGGSFSATSPPAPPTEDQ